EERPQQLAVQKLFKRLPPLTIFHLNRRRFHKICRRSSNRPLQPTVKRQLSTAHRVNNNTCRVGTIPNLELQLQVKWHATKAPPLKTDVGPLPVPKPRDVV